MFRTVFYSIIGLCRYSVQCSRAPYYSGYTGTVQYRSLRIWSEAPSSSSYSEPPPSQNLERGPLLNLNKAPS